MNYSFHPEAEKEFVEAIDYLEKIETGLGFEFAIEIYSTIERVIVSKGLANTGRGYT